jgi:hypothetical protein
MIRNDIREALMAKDRATREADITVAQTAVDTDFTANIWP